MKIFIFVILLFVYYKESYCIGSTPEGSLQVRHSKVRYLPKNNTHKTIYRPFSHLWQTTKSNDLKKTYNNVTENSKPPKKRTKKRNKLDKKENNLTNTPNSINVTEIIGYLNSNNDNIKVLNPKLSSHFNAFGQTVIHEDEDKNPIMSNVLVNLSSLQTNVKKFECDVNNGGCSQFCNESGHLKCSCLKGFVLGSDGKSCLDVDECANNNGDCSHTCINSHGSRRCTCPQGFRLSGNMRSCTDINECLLRNGHGPCQDTCFNTLGSYMCSCNGKGTRLGLDNHSCQDVDECSEKTSGCSHGCINIIGGFICTCPDDMELNSDLKTCYEIIEQNDAPFETVCPPLIPPEHGFLHCSQKRSGSSNRPDSVCELVCPIGYKTLGDYRVICEPNGSWNGLKSGKCYPLSDNSFDHRKNYIDFIWDYPKPKITCSASRLVYIKKEQKLAYVHFLPPKTNIEWRYVESNPPEIKHTLEAYLPQGHHWIVFKATHPETQLSAKCIISIIVKKEFSQISEYS